MKNLGLEFESPRIERYIAELEAFSGVADDQLRPAMQRLLQTTGSVTKSQELLAQALDISRGSGVDYETVVNDLSMAYVGQTRGLRKYSLGLTQAELKTMKFADVQERLNKAFSGANADFLTTYAGRLQLIQTAAANASETIGGALLDSLVSVFAAGDTTKFVSQIDALATKIADTVSAVVFGFQKLYVLTSDRAILASFNPFDDYEKNALAAIEAAEKAAKFRRNMPSMGYQGSQPMGIYETPMQRASRAKAERDAAKRAKELASLQKKTLDTQKKSLALQKASKTLNLEAIGIEAALKGEISETDRLSLLLQKSLLDGNASLATQLADQLEAAIKRQNEIRYLLLTTPKAPNPYADWKIPDLKMPSVSIPASLITATTEALGVRSIADIPSTNTEGFTDAQSEVFDAITDYIKKFGDPTKDPTVNVTVVLNDQEVGSAIRDVSVNDSLSGSFNTVNRVDRFRTLAI